MSFDFFLCVRIFGKEYLSMSFIIIDIESVYLGLIISLCFDVNLNIFLEPKLTEYFNFFILIFTIIIFYSQFLTLFLETLLSYPRYIIKIKKTKKFTYFGMIFISTLVTPPDIYSLILTSCFLISIYELFILLFLTFKKIYL